MERPALVSAVAILFFVFGGLGLFCFGAGTIYSAAGLDEAMFKAMPGPAGEEYIKQKAKTEKLLLERMPLSPVISPIQTVLTFGLCFLMIAAGIGLWLMRSWGRMLTLIYAPLSLLTTVFNTIYALAIVVPIQAELAKDMGGPPQQLQMQAAIGSGAGIISAILLCLFPLFVLICMLLPSVKTAFCQNATTKQSFEENP